MNEPDIRLSLRIEWGLRIWAACLLVGRAWQYLFWETPIDRLNPEILASKEITFVLGLLFLVGTGICLLGEKGKRNILRDRTLWVISGFLILHSVLAAREKHWYLSQLIEHGIQWALPVLVWEVLQARPNISRLTWLLRGAIALTFIGHGMYAANIFPTPAGFIDMTTRILPVSANEASSILTLAGVLDIGIGVILLTPFHRLGTYALWYAVIWGFLTALARVVAYVEWPTLGTDLHRWGWETVHRLGHGGVPWVLLMLWARVGDKDAQ